MDLVHITGEAINTELMAENQRLRATIAAQRSAIDALSTSHAELQAAYLAQGRRLASLDPTRTGPDYLAELHLLALAEQAYTVKVLAGRAS